MLIPGQNTSNRALAWQRRIEKQMRELFKRTAKIQKNLEVTDKKIEKIAKSSLKDDD